MQIKLVPRSREKQWPLDMALDCRGSCHEQNITI